MKNLLLMVKTFYVGQKVLTHFRIKRWKDFLFGEKTLHLVEPYTEWATRVDYKMRTYEYRKVYYWRGRLRSPFHRTHGRGIQLNDGVIVPHETAEAWQDALQKAEEEFKGVMVVLRKASNDAATERMSA